ncbi:hypothetical protein LEMLEM_LOCUS10119, partial [Lemmus lemmus]
GELNTLSWLTTFLQGKVLCARRDSTVGSYILAGMINSHLETSYGLFCVSIFKGQHDAFWPATVKAPGDATPSSGLLGHCMHMVHIYTYKQKHPHTQ